MKRKKLPRNQIKERVHFCWRPKVKPDRERVIMPQKTAFSDQSQNKPAIALKVVFCS